MTLKLLAAAVASACIAGVALAADAPVIPSTPAGEAFAAWLAVYDAGDPQAIAQFEASRAHADPPPDWARFRTVTGRETVVSVEDSSPFKIVTILKDENDRYARFAFEVEPDGAHRITAFSAQLIPAPAGALPQRLSEPALLAAVKAKVADEAAADKFSGAVLIAHHGKPIFEAAYGEADRERRIPNRLDTKFRVGSMDKMFTAVAVLQLEQAGKLKLDDPVIRFLPDYPNAAFARKVTIRELLTHTAGAGDIFTPEFETHRSELRDPKDYVALFGKRDPEFEPGSRWRYSNYGFELLGRIVEVASGERYDDYERKHVFGPAGMTSTGFLPESVDVPGRSIGYMKTQQGLAPNTATLPPKGSPAGGGYSTVGDLLRFAEALTHHRLLDAEHVRLLITGKVEGPPDGKYAFGFEDIVHGGVRSFGHGGGAPGQNGMLKVYPAGDYVVVVLANRDPPAAETIANFIDLRLPAS